jgi:hypothetical protein
MYTSSQHFCHWTPAALVLAPRFEAQKAGHDVHLRIMNQNTLEEARPDAPKRGRPRDHTQRVKLLLNPGYASLSSLRYRDEPSAADGRANVRRDAQPRR